MSWTSPAGNEYTVRLREDRYWLDVNNGFNLECINAEGVTLEDAARLLVNKYNETIAAEVATIKKKQGQPKKQPAIKDLHRDGLHGHTESHYCVVCEIKRVKIKITYLAGNAYERLNVEIFDGLKLNHILSIQDLGIKPEKSCYVWEPAKRKQRAEELILKAKAACTNIL